MDYRGNLAHTVASWILVPCGRSLDSPYFGDRRDRGRNQACHRSRGVGVEVRMEILKQILLKLPLHDTLPGNARTQPGSALGRPAHSHF